MLSSSHARDMHRVSRLTKTNTTPYYGDKSTPCLRYIVTYRPHVGDVRFDGTELCGVRCVFYFSCGLLSEMISPVLFVQTTPANAACTALVLADPGMVRLKSKKLPMHLYHRIIRLRVTAVLVSKTFIFMSADTRTTANSIIYELYMCIILRISHFLYSSYNY